MIGGNLEIEVGYTLRADCFGQGYGTEMARGIVDVATRELGLADLVAFTLPDNAASRRIMEKSGFVYERTLMHLRARSTSSTASSRSREGGERYCAIDGQRGGGAVRRS